jgi:4-hydroxybenzoate polyprenyltransferase
LTWLAAGKAHLKQRLAESTEIDVTSLPYDMQVIELIKEEKVKGREIVLATASHKIYADQIANHLQIFDRVLATEGKINLSARNKRDKLIEQYGENGFDYVGNSHDDLHVWKAARHAYVINPERGVETRARSLGNVVLLAARDANPIKDWAKALRFHQWVKNFLIFVPLLASHQFTQVDLLLNGLLAFICFGLCASSVYLLNDLLDLADDRQHAIKRHRPFASGKLSVKSGLFVFPILLFASFAGALWLLPSQFTAAMGVYYLITLAYSISLKRMTLVDAITLALLYTLRLIAGALVFGMTLTFWMVAFSMFMFLSLAFVKRYAELRAARILGKTGKTRGRGYYPDDLEMISSLGAASGYLSVMVLAFYIQDQNTVALYSRPQVIWLACPLLLFWISRVWLLTHRGQMHDDPVVFALKDRVSLLIGAAFGAVFWIAV